MRAYMAYSRHEGPQEAAILVIAPTARAAKLAAWRSRCIIGVDGWTDLAVRWIKNEYAARVLERYTDAVDPLVIDSPPGCVECGVWGGDDITPEGLCSHCGADPGDDILRLMGRL